MPEEKLNSEFGMARVGGAGAAPPGAREAEVLPAPPQTKGGNRPSAGFAFARNAKCECPKCLPVGRD